MVTTLFTALRRYAGIVFTLLLGVGLCVGAVGQGTSPLVTASFATGLDHPTGWGGIQQTAVDANGDWLVEDWVNGALYEFPADGSPMITLVPPAGLGSVGGYQNPTLLLDPAQNLYVGGNWNNCLLIFPYDPVAKTWPGLATLTAANPSPNDCASGNQFLFAQYGISGYSQGYFQPWGIALGHNNDIIIASQSSGNYIFDLAVNGAWATPTPASVINEPVQSMKKRAISIAQDPEGNIYFVEDSNGLPGVYEIPAGTTSLPDDTTVARIDPNLPSVQGVVTDATGNIYVSDNKAGVFLIPNPSGTPQTSAAVMLTPVPAQGEVAFDWARNIMYVPTSQKQSNGQADVAKVTLNYAEFGSSPVGTATPAGTVTFSFNGPVTPASFAIVESGVPSPDFSVTGGTCAFATAYAAASSCAQTVVMNPTTTGGISANLLMLDANNNVLGSMTLHGTGVAPSMQSTPAMESAIGGSLNTPTQMAVDFNGNTYVADSGLKQVLMYAAGAGNGAAGVAIGTGLTLPTGVAVDGGGDVFIADSGTGTVVEIPNSPSGLNAAAQISLVSGLGANLKLAIDGQGTLYVADPANARVVKLTNPNQPGTGFVAQSETFLTAGFTAPSYVAVDASDNLYVIDGANLFELAPGLTAPSTLINNLDNATSVAVDPSGAVYVAQTGGSIRIPSISGALSTASQAAVASSVTNPVAIALDKLGDVYIADGTAENIHFVSSSSLIDLGTLTTTSSTASAPVTVTNAGNGPLDITGFTVTNPLDYSISDVSCVSGSPIAVGASCDAEVTLDPGAGEEGTLTTQVSFKSNASNAAAVLNVTGVGAPLAPSISSMTIPANAEVVNTPVTVTVAPSSGSGTPTGTVTVTYPAVGGTTGSVSGTLTDGSVPLTLAGIAAGSQKISVAYAGDRTFGRSTSTITASIAKSAATIAMPDNPPPYLPYVLEQNGSTPYDGSVQYWQYNFEPKVNAAAGQPTGTVTFNEVATIGNPPVQYYSGVACPQAASGVEQVTANGSVSFPTSCLQMPQNVTYTPMASTHTITPVYSGDANYLGYTGQPVTFIVVRSPAVMISSSPSTLSVNAGSSATANLTLTSVLGYGFAGKGSQLNDYNFPVTLGCSSLPPHATCSFTYPPATVASSVQPIAPNSVQIPCTGTTGAADNCQSGTATITINTNVAVGTTNSASRLAPVTLGSLFGIGLIGLAFRRRFNQSGRLMLILCMVLISGALATSLTACATTNLSPSSVLTTPKGTYNVTVTAQQVGTQVITLSTGPITIYGSQDQVSLPFTIEVTVQ